MKALVLAGGTGTRMRPITNTFAKQLIPVANKPVLFYGLEAIRDAGVTDVGIVVGDTAAEIEASVGDGAPLGIDVTYIRQQAPRGLAHAVLVSRDYLANDDFVMYLGDNFIAGGIAEFVAAFQATRPAAQIQVARVPNPTAFGVAELAGAGCVARLTEKPRHPKSDLAVAGVYMFTPAVHEAVRRVTPSWRGELEITDAVQWLIDAGMQVTAATIAGYWKDTGNVGDMLEVNRLVLDELPPAMAGTIDQDSELVGPVAIEEGAEVCGSRVIGPAIVGPRTRIADSRIGPYTSIAGGCLIAGSEVADSIVLAGTSIRGATRIESSLIGRDVDVAPALPTPTAHRLVLGDHCKVRIGS